MGTKAKGKGTPKFTPEDVEAERVAIKRMGLKVGMVVKSTAQPGRVGKIVAIDDPDEEGKSPMVHFKKQAAGGPKYRNRPTLVTTDVEAEEE